MVGKSLFFAEYMALVVDLDFDGLPVFVLIGVCAYPVRVWISVFVFDPSALCLVLIDYAADIVVPVVEV